MSYCRLLIGVCIIGLALDSAPARAQGTVADYARAITLRDRYQGLAVNVPEYAESSNVENACRLQGKRSWSLAKWITTSIPHRPCKS